MKKNILFFLGFAALAACNENKPKSLPVPFPKPGTLITSAEQPITDDPLNKFTYSVKIIADSAVTSGIYDIDVDFGPNFAEGKLTLPKGGEHFTPAIRKGNTGYSYIIGFHVPGDTTFYDYMEVTSSRSNTKMQYIKAYTF
jgi:hypothetical protein